LSYTQIHAQVQAQCSIIQTGLSVALLSPGANLTSLTDVSKTVNSVCAADATLDAASLQTLIDTALPAILAIAKNVPNPDPQVQAVIDGVTLAQALLPVMVAQIKALPTP
jgi:hypothetical protein